jgi:hypothetical protein
MLELASDLGFSETAHPREPGMREIRLELAA